MIGLIVVDGDTSNKDVVAKAKAMGKSRRNSRHCWENCNEEDFELVEYQKDSCNRRITLQSQLTW